MENKTAAGLTSPTDGPSGFVEFAADGSWLARFGQAGHMAFVDPGRGRPLQLARSSLLLVVCCACCVALRAPGLVQQRPPSDPVHLPFPLHAGTATSAAVSCPTVEPSTAVQPDALALTAAFLATRLRGEQGAGELAAMWAAAKPASHLSFSTKGAAAVAAAR